MASMANRLRMTLFLTVLLFSSRLAPSQNQPVRFDILVTGGTVVDGSGSAPYRADLGITGDRIAAIGDLSSTRGKQVIDADGLIVTAGFIDPHSHASSGLRTKELSGAEPLLAQGITTVFVNPDGGGAVDLVKQRRGLLVHGLGINVASLVPFGAIRQRILGQSRVAASRAQLDGMRALIISGMKAGAYGVSSGLFYQPQGFASTAEIIEVLGAAIPYGGVHQSHIRDEADYSVGLLAAVDETIEITRATGLKGVITHIKALGPRVWGLSAKVIRRIEAARAGGLDIFADQYPYDASATNLHAALIPRWAQEGGRRALRKRFEKAETRRRILEGMKENLARRGGAARLRFTGRPGLAGKTLADAAKSMKLDPVAAAVELIKSGSTGVVSFNMREEDIRAFMTRTWTMTCSDGGLVSEGSGRPHPRNRGAFARKIRKYVVEDEVVSLARAIRGMTGLTAEVYGVAGRGILVKGAYADLAVFDPKKVRDRATYDDPHRVATGMNWVIVNGKIAFANGALTSERAGRALIRARTR